MINKQHPAQDEREAFEAACMAAGLVRPGNYSPDFDLYVSERVQGRYEGFKLGRAAQTAQTEQQPVRWQFYQDGKWWNGDDRIKDHRKNTKAAGIPVRDLYAAPIALTEQQPVAWVEVKNRHEGPYEFHGIELLDSGKHYLYATPIAQTEQQPVAYADPQTFVNFGKARQDGIEAGPRTHDWMWATPGSRLVPLYAAPIAAPIAQTEQQPIEIPVGWPALVERAAQILDAEQERLSAEGYLMDSEDCIKVLREALAAHIEQASAQYERDFNPDHTLFSEIRCSMPVNDDGEETRYIINEQQLQRILALEFNRPAQRERIDPFSVAEAIRKALDRNSCPNVFLVIAYEAAIKALSQQAEPSKTRHAPHCLLLDPEEPQCHCTCGLEPPPAQTAPQPEQSGLLEALERVKLTEKEARHHSVSAVAYWNNAVTACIAALSTQRGETK